MYKATIRYFHVSYVCTKLLLINISMFLVYAQGYYKYCHVSYVHTYKVDIAEPEAASLLQMMDLDRDGAVSVDDFMVIMFVFKT